MSRQVIGAHDLNRAIFSGSDNHRHERRQLVEGQQPPRRGTLSGKLCHHGHGKPRARASQGRETAAKVFNDFDRQFQVLNC